MRSRHHKRLVRWIALAATLLCAALLTLSPRVASAAFLPACENQELTRMPAEWLAVPPPPAAEACSLAAAILEAGDDEQGDPRVAAMCDARGASMVAPQRILPIADAHIDAAGCSAPEIGAGAALDASSDDAPLGGPGVALVDPAVLGAATQVPPAPSELLPPYPAAADRPLAGVKQAIDHPPRS
jgi:hypothetical protein